MLPYLPLDRRETPGIQSALQVLMLSLWLLSGCQRQEAPASKPNPPVVDPLADTSAGTAPDAATPDRAEPPDGFFGSGENAVVRAVAKAPKGEDVDLSRQTASNRARHKIAAILKEKGYSLHPPGILRRVTIERIWTKGRFVYALGVLPLSELPQAPTALNHPGSGPSNPKEAGKPDPRPPPKGGTLP